MSKMVQIRNMPDFLHRRYKAKAATAGMSLSDYLIRELRRLDEQPTMEEFFERLRTRERARVSEAPAEIIRRDRDSRA